MSFLRLVDPRERFLVFADPLAYFDTDYHISTGKDLVTFDPFLIPEVGEARGQLTAHFIVDYELRHHVYIVDLSVVVRF